MSGHTITTAGAINARVGDKLTIKRHVPDYRWWRRAWFWLLRKGDPYRIETKTVTVTEMVGSTSFEVRP